FETVAEEGAQGLARADAVDGGQGPAHPAGGEVDAEGLTVGVAEPARAQHGECGGVVHGGGDEITVADPGGLEAAFGVRSVTLPGVVRRVRLRVLARPVGRVPVRDLAARDPLPG